MIKTAAQFLAILAVLTLINNFDGTSADTGNSHGGCSVQAAVEVNAPAAGWYLGRLTGSFSNA